MQEPILRFEFRLSLNAGHYGLRPGPPSMDPSDDKKSDPKVLEDGPNWAWRKRDFLRIHETAKRQAKHEAELCLAFLAPPIAKTRGWRLVFHFLGPSCFRRSRFA